MSEKLSPKYYQKNKEWLQEKAYTRYKNLSKDEKEEKPQYHCEHYKNLSEDEKKVYKEYRKKYKIRKILYYNHKKVF